jgi:simple sugar transport system ATP-binding protein
MNGITKAFPGVIANENISFQVQAGEIHALLGENGAGKSTLMSILAGLYQPDAGTIKVKGEIVKFKSPRLALASGVGMIYQHFRLVDNFTVAENIILGTPSEAVRLNSRAIEQVTANLSKKFGLEINPGARVSHLSLGEQQRVEILKMLYRGCDILIMDEPTTVLNPQEVQDLFGMLRKMTDQGKAIILITHKLSEVLEIADTVTVLRKGQVVGSEKTAQLDEKALTKMMVGRELADKHVERHNDRGPLVLALDKLKVIGDQGHIAVHDLDLSIHRGEIVGIAGVAGNGQRELVESIVGLRAISAGHIRLQDQDIGSTGVRDRLARGMNMVPEDRMGMGLVPNLTIMENAILRSYYKQEFSHGFVLDFQKIRAYTHKLVEDYNVSLASIQHPINYLSGGNLQKLLLGREISQKPRLLIASYPVRGLDVASTEAVFQLLLSEREKGTAILLILEDLEDIFRLADRIAVMYAGTIKAVLNVEETNVQEVGLLMLGSGEKVVKNA